MTPVDSPASETVRTHSFLERVLGWGDTATVARSLHAVHLAATHQAVLVLCGDGDLVQVARGLHRAALGDEHPFVLCDPVRRATGTGASIENHKTGPAALAAALGGSVCMRTKRLPRGFTEFAVTAPGVRVQLILCGDRLPKLADVVSAPIVVPALAARSHEIDRVIDEYAREAQLALGTSPLFTDTDRAWVREHAATSLPEVETATLRVVALRRAGNVVHAAELLGMTHSALGEWFARRRQKRRVR